LVQVALSQTQFSPMVLMETTLFLTLVVQHKTLRLAVEEEVLETTLLQVRLMLAGRVVVQRAVLVVRAVLVHQAKVVMAVMVQPTALEAEVVRAL
jgi:hypothetical protein